MPFAKTPKTTYGIELEFGINDNENSPASRVYHHFELFFASTPKLHNKWEIKGDGSVSGDRGSEIATMGAHELPQLLSELKIVCAELKKYEKSGNIKIDTTCGFHVHIGVQNWTIQHLRTFYECFYASLNEWFSFQPQSRADNSYCYENRYDDLFSELQRDERYVALNPVALVKHGTLELRLFGGTIQYYKIEKTLQVINAYIKGVLKPLPDGERPKAKLFDVIDNKKLLKFIVSRVKKTQRGNGSLIHKFETEFREKAQKSA